MSPDAAISGGVPVNTEEPAVRLLEDLCVVSSATGDADGIRRCALRLGRELEELGFSTEIEDRPNALDEPQPVLIGHSPGSGREHVLLIGHLDTVLPAVAPRRRDDRLYGTGSLDMKGGFAALVGALRHRRAGGSGHRRSRAGGGSR